MFFFSRSLLLVYLICSLVIVTSGQAENSSGQREIWRTRAETFTLHLLKDASKSDSLDRALLLTQLGDLWWEFDKNQSNTWIEKAVDTMFFYSSEEIKSDSERFFQTTRQILRIISNRNQKQSDRLVKILSEADKFIDKEKNTNADSLIEHALQTLKENPSKAFQLGILALRAGQPKEFYKLSWELRRYNPVLANQFFRTVLSGIMVSGDLEMLNSMQLASFPENFVPEFPPNLAPPKELKTEFLNFLADYAVRQHYKLVSKSIQSCAVEANIVSRVRNQFIALMPQKIEIVQQALDFCLAGQNQKLTQTQSQTASLKTSDIDELLKLADEVEDTPNVRGVYLFKAALSANQQKKYVLSIKILESMSEEERAIFADNWEDLRHDSAALLAYIQVRDGDSSGALETIKNVPDKLRPLAQVGFVMQFSPQDVVTYSFCIERLNEARRGFIKSELPFAKRTSYWFNLVKLYSNYKMQTEAAEVFRDITVAFNNSLSDNSPKNNVISIQLAADSKRIIPTLSPTLLESQENSIHETIASLKQEKPRIEINLAFLEVALRQYKSFGSASSGKSAEKFNDKTANFQ
jgi:hypothetical protein